MYGQWSSVEDVLDERRRAEALFRAQVEHRLKTSLQIIAGWAATLDDAWDRLSEDRRRDGVRVMRRESDDLTDQTFRLLQQTRAELLALDLHPQALDLGRILDSAARALDGCSDAHDVVHVTSGERVPVTVDPTALHEVLANLVENAVKYSPAGTTIALRALVDADHGAVVLEVVDQGIGIPDGIDLFAPFQRGVGTHTPGTGLGLYIVRNLIEAMGGEITARRNGDGPGSTLSVRLPVAGKGAEGP